VSPSWHDRVKVFLGPASVQLARFGKGWRPTEGLSLAQPCGRANGVPWQPALDALDRALGMLEFQGADGDVSISSHFVRYALVPAADKLRGGTERLAAARHQLRSIYGERADSWRVALSANGGSSIVVAAIDSELLDGIKTSLARARLRAVAIEPYLATAFNSCRKAIGAEAWLAVVEPGRLALGYFKKGNWLGLRNQRMRDNGGDELLVALEQARLADGIEAAPGRVLLVSREPGRIAFPPASGWTLEPVPVTEPR
jgi:hypothetical protein